MVCFKKDGEKDIELSYLFSRVANQEIPNSGPRPNKLLLMREFGADIESVMRRQVRSWCEQPLPYEQLQVPRMYDPRQDLYLNLFKKGKPKAE